MQSRYPFRRRRRRRRVGRPQITKTITKIFVDRVMEEQRGRKHNTGFAERHGVLQGRDRLPMGGLIE